ncbi:hypothetical protein [Escherichia coli]|uniref:hypothetical protein n=1 Tax=Escherichia coli TaxID=562 RepID=UPI000BE14C9E|nr:hypothetical protein [Escherichia coli]
MGESGEHVPLFTTSTFVDFMASTQAFREYQKKLPLRDPIPPEIPEDCALLYLERLKYYR